MRVLVAEDDEIQAELVQATLEVSGYDVTLVHDGKEALEQVRTGEFRLVISDWEMPNINGLDLCRRIRARRTSDYVYVILLTQKSGSAKVVEGMRAGADDFISKPFHPQELCIRLRAAERILSLQSRDLTIFALAKLTESRDQETGAHLERMREYCRVIAQELTTRNDLDEEVDGEFIHLIYLTSPLHDIGKVGVPDSVLLKPGRLTDDEFCVMQQHTVIGGQTLDSLASAYPDAGFLQMARDIAWTHHEKFDGSGYPNHLSGKDIPLCGRIVALADVYDALTTRRVYKEAFSHEKAKAIIEEGSGGHFDPRIVEVFLKNQAQFVDILERFSPEEAEQTSGTFAAC